ncbi:hypothetical protein CEE45_01295 [Candidatus Heimdallarchaeota archaeon B3_Heim]|nr:MAG: hypothetical protein CEE45_01295 [Candidatus Heimdallarchaeota archaeon B3_Heim]
MIITRELKTQNYVIDCNLVLAGAMLHDIGRSRSHKLDHGIIGGKLLKEEKFPAELISIIENHVFAGISKEEALEFNLPHRDFLPHSLEEKVVAYSDNISKSNAILTTEQVIIRYSRYLDEKHSIIQRVWDLHNEIESLLVTQVKKG